VPSRILNPYSCRRRAWRWRVKRGQEAVVEFDLPRGWRWTLSLVEISDGGVGFRLDNGRPELAIGTRIDDVIVDVGAIQVTGSVRVLHVTEDAGADSTCGAAFTPATEDDRRMLDLILFAFEDGSSRSD
jgi:c-di-GMP-binding flagellar brake protein YcgR